jgi:large subunit ribosomal protein L9
MRVILRTDIAGLGKRGDICEVKDGYGRNFLFPGGKALPASDGAVAQAAAMRRRRDLRDAADKDGAQEKAKILVARTITIPAKAGKEGRLYGSITTADISAAIAEQTDIAIDRKQLHVEPIKALGTYSVAAKLHSDVAFPITLEIVAR